MKEPKLDMKNTLDPGLRRDDSSSALSQDTVNLAPLSSDRRTNCGGPSTAHSDNVIPAQAGIQQLAGGPSFDVIRSNRFSALLPLITAVIMLYAISIPWWGESSWMREVVEISCYFIFAMMWNLLAGYGGMVSIGQQAFLGFGGYIMLILGNEAGMNPFVAIPIAALATVAIAYPVSFIAFRLQGGYFAIGTWVIAEVFRLSFANLHWVGGGSGTSLIALREIEKSVRESTTYFIAMSCVVAVTFGVYAFLRSKRGLALLAIRDNEVAASSQGIDVSRMKLAVYLIAAGGAGLAGALYFVSNLRISPDAAFSVNWTAFAIFMVVIGGIGRIEGPIIGALLFWFLNKFFSDYGSWYLVGLGLIAIVVTVFFRDGIWGALQRRYGWSLFPTHRYLKLTT
jgi:branched-chain amino acid transport system permease protein